MSNCRPLSHYRVISSFFSKAIFAELGHGAILCVFLLSLFLTPLVARAQISELNDDVLRSISGQSGLSIMMEQSVQFHMDYLNFSDTQNGTHPNWIQLKNFDVSGSATVGTPFSFATYWDGVSVLMPNTIDVATDGSGQTFVSMTDTSQMSPRWYSVQDVLFENYNGSSYDTPLSLGSLNLDALRQGPSLLNYWAHAGQGINFEYRTAISANALTYTYNTTPTTLNLTGINIAGSATGAPETPGSWAYSGTFKIGTIGDTYNTPATIDVATDGSNNTSLYLSLPMAGTIRVADVNFGGTSFGPIAIDDIQVHRLNVKISP